MKAHGIIKYNKVGPLSKYEGTMTAQTYITTLQDNLLPMSLSLKGTRTRESKQTFFYDGASAHRAQLTQDWFKENKINAVILPPKSPDINIIENCWSLVKDELFKKNQKLKTQEQIWQEGVKIWNDKVPKITSKLYDSIPERLQCIIDSDGKRIKT